MVQIGFCAKVMLAVFISFSRVSQPSYFRFERKSRKKERDPVAAIRITGRTVRLNRRASASNTAADETSLVFFKSMFTTAAYVPLILVAVFETAFWILHYKLSMREGNAATEEHAQPVADVSVLPAERGAFTPSDLQYLRELKKLCDEGVLTQQEFDEAKAKYFER